MTGTLFFACGWFTRSAFASCDACNAKRAGADIFFAAIALIGGLLA